MKNWNLIPSFQVVWSDQITLTFLSIFNLLEMLLANLPTYSN